MSEELEKELLRLAEAVSDGTPVDWERERGSHPGMKQPLEHLALLDRVRQVHEESSRVLIDAERNANRTGPTASEATPRSARFRRRALWIAVLVPLAVAVAFALYRLYKSATNAAM
jgi:hypothetical protein